LIPTPRLLVPLTLGVFLCCTIFCLAETKLLDGWFFLFFAKPGGDNSLPPVGAGTKTPLVSLAARLRPSCFSLRGGSLHLGRFGPFSAITFFPENSFLFCSTPVSLLAGHPSSPDFPFLGLRTTPILGFRRPKRPFFSTRVVPFPPRLLIFPPKLRRVTVLRCPSLTLLPIFPPQRAPYANDDFRRQCEFFLFLDGKLSTFFCKGQSSFARSAFETGPFEFFSRPLF